MDIITTLGGTVIRHGLSALGTWLVAKGYIDAETASSLATQLSGAALIVLAAIMSYIKAKKAE